jgi:hypothetical protein
MLQNQSNLARSGLLSEKPFPSLIPGDVAEFEAALSNRIASNGWTASRQSALPRRLSAYSEQ